MQILTIGIIKCELVHLWNFRIHYVSFYYTLTKFRCTFKIRFYLLYIIYSEHHLLSYSRNFQPFKLYQN